MSTKWNADIMFPSDNTFVNRILAIKAALSNDGNPMITIETEVVSPTVYEVNSEEINIQGVKATTYQTYKVFNEDGSVNTESTEKCQKRVKELLKNLEIPEEDINWDNLGPVIAPLKGKLIMTQMNSRIDPQRRTPTTVQIEAAKKTGKRPEGDIMKHPKTGRDMIKYWPNVVEIFGLSPV
jgi:hypothetical protein